MPRRGGARPLGVPRARSAAPCSSHARRRRSASASAAFKTASSSSCSCSRCSSADTRSSTSIPLVPDKLSSRRQEIAGCEGHPGAPTPRGKCPSHLPGAKSGASHAPFISRDLGLDRLDVGQEEGKEIPTALNPCPHTPLCRSALEA